MEETIHDIELPPQSPMTDAEKAELLYRYLVLVLKHPPMVTRPYTR